MDYKIIVAKRIKFSGAADTAFTSGVKRIGFSGTTLFTSGAKA